MALQAKEHEKKWPAHIAGFLEAPSATVLGVRVALDNVISTNLKFCTLSTFYVLFRKRLRDRLLFACYLASYKTQDYNFQIQPPFFENLCWTGTR
jgi:hypothetical protein